jgi:hypothetical protein
LTEPDQKRSYPYLATSAWADLRKKLRGSIPRKIDKDYLHTVLGVSDKAAANLMPQLKTLGLVDDDGSPTDLVHDLRDDHKYAEACQAIIARVYPPALTDAVQNPTDDFEAAVRWFMRQGAGEGLRRSRHAFTPCLPLGRYPSHPTSPRSRPNRHRQRNRQRGRCRQRSPPRNGGVMRHCHSCWRA